MTTTADDLPVPAETVGDQLPVPAETVGDEGPVRAETLGDGGCSPRVRRTLARCADLHTEIDRLAGAAVVADTLATDPRSEALTIDDELASVVDRLQALRLELETSVEAARSIQVERALAGVEPLRLDIGPGGGAAPGWIGVDLMGGDVTCDLRAPLPLPDGCASHVYACHVLEHLRHPDEAHAFLLECRRVLRRGGKLRVVVPNIAVYLRAALDDDTDFWAEHAETWDWSRVDANRLDQALHYAGTNLRADEFWGHRHGYAASSLHELLASAGFGPTRTCSFQGSPDEAFRIDDRSAVAHASHDGVSLSLFAEGYRLF